ncbi:HNH endonuclease [Vibrio sp. YMD68]|uniref:HNH endonuclease n=1 Tax=Vibrio sp. YMD68 TaxID=3042300 RepID=UPI002499C668|nr:HNH endonuclease [Vibrio sp. YMD68]WGV98806.1 HNH endonuclease [Vibrio sp. YMD68]
MPNYSSVDATKLASGNPNIGTPWQSLSPEAILQQVGHSGIQAGVDSAINGTDFSDGFVNSLRGGLANNVGAIAANQIGDWGVTHGLSEGGFTKSLLHGVSQGAVAELAGGEFIAGAAAGVATELAGSTLGNSGLEEKTQVDVAGLIGAVAGVAVTGDAEGAYTGQNAGGIVHQNNYLNHTDIKNALKDFTVCNGNTECEVKVIVEAKILSEDKDTLALSDCSEGDCKPHSRDLANATLPDNADIHYELIGDSQRAQEFYNLMKKENTDSLGPMTDASVQNNLTDWVTAMGFSDDVADMAVAGTGLFAGIQKNSKKNTSGSNQNAVSDGINGPPKVDKESDALQKPLTSIEVREALGVKYGPNNVKSTTVALNPRQRVNSAEGIDVVYDSYGNKGVKVVFQDPLTLERKSVNVAYDSQRGLPVFDDHSKYTTSIVKPDGYENMSSNARKSAEMRAATRDLRDKINSGQVDKNQFTETQLKFIQAGKESIPNYTWHHNVQSSPKNMQLIPKAVHDAVKHIGEASLSEGN